jgi:hypothetical protein
MIVEEASLYSLVASVPLEYQWPQWPPWNSLSISTGGSLEQRLPPSRTILKNDSRYQLVQDHTSTVDLYFGAFSFYRGLQLSMAPGRLAAAAAVALTFNLHVQYCEMQEQQFCCVTASLFIHLSILHFILCNDDCEGELVVVVAIFIFCFVH